MRREPFAAKRVDPLRSQTGLSRDAIIDRMKATFTGLSGAVAGEITEAEYARATELVETKFGTEEWIGRVP